MGFRAYRNFRPHRALTVGLEFQLYLKRFLLMPLHRWERRLATRRIRRGGFPYHLAILQLEHDASFRDHSPFASMTDFLALVIRGFAKGAPPHHHLVFKAHPLEDGRGGIRQAIADKARGMGIADRVHYVRGGKLAQLLNQARAVVTVNSTSAQQALWRGLPVKAMGRAVYDKPGIVSHQELAEFLKEPKPPQPAAYRHYRDFLLESSQVPGGFYSERSRGHALRIVADLMLAEDDPYEALLAGRGKHRQQMETYTE
jgi:capsular polysaccharide export protein